MCNIVDKSIRLVTFRMECCYNYWCKKKLEDELPPKKQVELKDLMKNNDNQQILEELNKYNIKLRSIVDCTRKRRFFK